MFGSSLPQACGSLGKGQLKVTMVGSGGFIGHTLDGLADPRSISKARGVVGELGGLLLGQLEGVQVSLGDIHSYGMISQQRREVRHILPKGRERGRPRSPIGVGDRLSTRAGCPRSQRVPSVSAQRRLLRKLPALFLSRRCSRRCRYCRASLQACARRAALALSAA